MDWKFKTNAPMQGSSDGFWYDITDGGYIRPKEVLEDQSQIDAIFQAICLLESFKDALKEKDILEEF